MRRTDVTVRLPTDLMRAAQAWAARQGVTLDALIAELLTQHLHDVAGAARAIERFLALSGEVPLFDAAGIQALRREDLHERQ